MGMESLSLSLSLSPVTWKCLTYGWRMGKTYEEGKEPCRKISKVGVFLA
jgi:hypothetical protein